MARADQLDQLRLWARLGLAGPEMARRLHPGAGQSRVLREPVRNETRLRRRRRAGPAGAVPVRYGPWPGQARSAETKERKQRGGPKGERNRSNQTKKRVSLGLAGRTPNPLCREGRRAARARREQTSAVQFQVPNRDLCRALRTAGLGDLYIYVGHVLRSSLATGTNHSIKQKNIKKSD